MVNISLPSIHIFPASPGSGKSYLIKFLVYLLSKKKQIDYWVVFCGTAFNDSYSFIPEGYVFTNYDENVLGNCLRFQSQSTKKPSLGIIFDDCISFETDMRRGRIISKLFTEFRHYNCTVFVATQYMYRLPPVVRESAAYYWLFPQRTNRSWGVIYEVVGSNNFENFNEFKKFVLTETSKERYTVVFCDRVKGIFESFKASRIPDFFLEYF
jgi:hypothetical protein